MSDSLQLANSIRKEMKHKDAGHSGGTDGCPLCSRPARPIEEEILADEAPIDAADARLSRILGDK